MKKQLTGFLAGVFAVGLAFGGSYASAATHSIPASNHTTKKPATKEPKKPTIPTLTGTNVSYTGSTPVSQSTGTYSFNTNTKKLSGSEQGTYNGLSYSATVSNGTITKVGASQDKANTYLIQFSADVAVTFNTATTPITIHITEGYLATSSNAQTVSYVQLQLQKAYQKYQQGIPALTGTDVLYMPSNPSIQSTGTYSFDTNAKTISGNEQGTFNGASYTATLSNGTIKKLQPSSDLPNTYLLQFSGDLSVTFNNSSTPITYRLNEAYLVVSNPSSPTITMTQIRLDKAYGMYQSSLPTTSPVSGSFDVINLNSIGTYNFTTGQSSFTGTQSGTYGGVPYSFTLTGTISKTNNSKDANNSIVLRYTGSVSVTFGDSTTPITQNIDNGYIAFDNSNPKSPRLLGVKVDLSQAFQSYNSSLPSQFPTTGSYTFGDWNLTFEGQNVTGTKNVTFNNTTYTISFTGTIADIKQMDGQGNTECATFSGSYNVTPNTEVPSDKSPGEQLGSSPSFNNAKIIFDDNTKQITGLYW